MLKVQTTDFYPCSVWVHTYTHTHSHTQSGGERLMEKDKIIFKEIKERQGTNKLDTKYWYNSVGVAKT